jgi:hypothetical protein
MILIKSLLWLLFVLIVVHLYKIIFQKKKEGFEGDGTNSAGAAGASAAGASAAGADEADKGTETTGPDMNDAEVQKILKLVANVNNANVNKKTEMTENTENNKKQVNTLTDDINIENYDVAGLQNTIKELLQLKNEADKINEGFK